MYDTLIIGSGPAGLTAAIYASRAGLRFAVAEKEYLGTGQLAFAERVDNFPTQYGIEGFELGEKMRSHAEQLGTDIYTASQALNASQTVLSLSGDGDDGGLDIPIPSPEEALTDRLSLRQAVEALDSDEQSLIRLRYYQHKTQTQTAEALGTTQVQISRREKKILLKLRAQLI